MKQIPARLRAIWRERLAAWRAGPAAGWRERIAAWRERSGRGEAETGGANGGAESISPEERDRRAIIMTVALTATAHVGLTGGRIAVTLGGIELGASAFTAGLLVAFFSLLPMFLSVATGRLIDRIGPTRPTVWGLAVMSAGILAPLLSWEVGTLFFCSTMVGLGYMGVNTATQKLAGEIGGPDKRRFNFSLMAIGFSVSAFVSPIVTGVMIDLAGYRAAFGLLLLSPIAALTLLRWQRLDPRLRSPIPRLAQGLREESVLDLIRDPRMLRIYLVVAVISTAWDIHQFVVPIYGKQIGLSASVIGLLLGAYALATFLVRLAMPFLSGKLSEWTLIMSSLVIGCIAYALYPISTWLPMMLALSFMLGIGLGSSQPLIMSLIHRYAPPERVGEAVGFRMMLVHGTQAFLPGAFGAVGGLIGIAPLFFGMALLLGGTFGYVWPHERKRENN